MYSHKTYNSRSYIICQLLMASRWKLRANIVGNLQGNNQREIFIILILQKRRKNILNFRLELKCLSMKRAITRLNISLLKSEAHLLESLGDCRRIEWGRLKLIIRFQLLAINFWALLGKILIRRDSRFAKHTMRNLEKLINYLIHSTIHILAENI